MHTKHKRVIISAVLAALSMAAWAGVVPAADMPVPAELQAAIFKKIFEYAKAFSNPSEVTVLVTGGSGSVPQEIVKAFAAAGITAKITASADLDKNLSPKSVVYVLGDVGAAKGACEKSGVLSITGLPGMVESGDVAVGLGIEGGKPKIIVNKARLEKEKQELSAKLLQLAKVFG